MTLMKKIRFGDPHLPKAVHAGVFAFVCHYKLLADLFPENIPVIADTTE